MTELLDTLSANVRRLRELHGLSLSQLGERSGIAKGTLFKVERSQTNPNLETLQAIAATFGVPVTALLSAPSGPVVEMLAQGEGEEINEEAAFGRVVRRQLVGAGTVEIHAKTFLAGKVHMSVSHGPGTREHVFVRNGSITLGPLGHEVEAVAGSYVTYPADRSHRWQAAPEADVDLWIVHTFPRTTPLKDAPAAEEN